MILQKKYFLSLLDHARLCYYIICAAEYQTKAEISHVGNFTGIGPATEETCFYDQTVTAEEVLIKQGIKTEEDEWMCIPHYGMKGLGLEIFHNYIYIYIYIMY